MVAHCKSLVGCSLMLAAFALPGLAQEPEHFYQFFEKGKLVQISSSRESDFLSAVLVTAEDMQRLTDSQTLTTEEMVEKYPDLREKVDAAQELWHRNQLTRLPQDTKPKVVFIVGRTPFTYRIVTVKPDYLLVESVASPTVKRVYAIDKIKSIGWSNGIEARAIAENAELARPR